MHIPENYRGNARMDISLEGKKPGVAFHTYTLYENLHGDDMCAEAQREHAIEFEPSANIEARLDGISKEAVSMIQVWLGLPEQRRRITRAEIVRLLEDYPHGLFG
jgi:hypothetical protein